MNDGPLAGVRAVELVQPHGEWLGKLLAGLGAEVVKVEPPGGAPSRGIGPFAGDQPGPDRSLFFWQFNAGKCSVELDTSSRGGQDALSRLLAGCDVFIETMLQTEAGDLGLDYASLSAAHPRLVQISVTPFGQSGPYVDAAYETTDLVTMALGGPMQSCGYDPEEGLPPVRPGLHHSYYAACHYGCIATLVALWERETSGLGQYVDVSLQAALAVTNEFANLHWEYARAPVIRQTGRHAFPRITPPMQLYSADGKMINDKFS